MICGLQDSLDDIEILCKGYIERNGYIFTSLTYPYNVYDTIVINHPMNADINYPRYGKSIKSLDDHISLINKYQLEKAVLLVASLDFIVKCPSLKYMHIVPLTDKDIFDFSPIYDMPEIISLDCQTCYGSEEQLCGYIDYQKVNGLNDLSVSGKGHVNYNKICTLKSLQISNIKINNLTDAFCSSKLDTMRVITCGIKSLDGIEKSKKFLRGKRWREFSLLPSFLLTKKVIMKKIKLVIHECYAAKRKSEEVLAAVFLTNIFKLAESTKPRHY